jgi:zeaxanthin glucosyltransferase
VTRALFAVHRDPESPEAALKIAFVVLPAPGHLYPTTTLARRLRARGHDVVMIAAADVEPFIRGADLAFVPFGEKRYPPGRLAEIFEQLSKLQGQEALAFTFQKVAEFMEMAFAELPEVLREQGVDGVVLDEAMFDLGLVPKHLGMPYVHVSNALPFDFSGNTPLCVYPWPHETTALARNREGVQRFAQIDKARIEVVRAYAKKVGLDIDWNDPFATISRLAWMVQMPREFDFEAAVWPKRLHYTGPWHDGAGRMDIPFPWDRLTGDPLIYASMGTLMNGLEGVFSTIAEAVGNRRGLQLVLSIGPNLHPSHIQSVPANAIVVQQAPQLELLKRSVLCITHAGLNTTLESLAQGVPMVALPVANDQFGVGARIAQTRTGVVVDLPGMTAAKLSPVIDEVLSNPEYRQNAEKLKKAIDENDGLERAVDLLEEAFFVVPSAAVAR